MEHPIGILKSGSGIFPREALDKMQAQCFTARQEAVMRIREGEGGKEGKGLFTDLTLTAADPNPVMILIVSLFATATVADDRVTVANRAMSQDELGADGSPIRFELANPVGKWDNENREEGRFCHGVCLERMHPEPNLLTSFQRNLNWEKNSAATKLLPILRLISRLSDANCKKHPRFASPIFELAPQSTQTKELTSRKIKCEISPIFASPSSPRLRVPSRIPPTPFCDAWAPQKPPHASQDFDPPAQFAETKQLVARKNVRNCPDFGVTCVTKPATPAPSPSQCPLLGGPHAHSWHRLSGNQTAQPLLSSANFCHNDAHGQRPTGRLAHRERYL